MTPAERAGLSASEIPPVWVDDGAAAIAVQMSDAMAVSLVAMPQVLPGLRPGDNLWPDVHYVSPSGLRLEGIHVTPLHKLGLLAVSPLGRRVAAQRVHLDAGVVWGEHAWRRTSMGVRVTNFLLCRAAGQASERGMAREAREP